MANKLDRILSLLLTASAVVIAGATVYKVTRPPSAPADNDNSARPVFVKTWQEARAAGHLIGRPEAPVTIVAISDVTVQSLRHGWHERPTA